MIFDELALSGTYLIKPQYFHDNRGSFGRLLCKDELKKIGHTEDIVQVNHSINSTKGSIRGMHYQISPCCEVKIIKCLKGAIWDVIIDLRKNSPTFLQWTGIEISAKNQHIIYIPKGFAHGFQVLENDSELLYMHTANYSPAHERAMNYNDPKFGIDWPLTITEVSTKDSSHLMLDENFKGLEI